ncbi:GAF and ANTAR domain-containing protein [Blastococcus sp. KM273129]|uniref:GAF and ANTAR domain-containing protein n=1 Tax=Blastococcus sp. KM273129 TaxID=2570315 RepID=UPI001F1AD703|nr:GAF and ANTAR domain-containing protein [Blastococcus sp. KM273129]
MSQRLADLAREMQSQADAPAVLDLIVASVAGTVPGAEEATISLVQARRRVVSAVATGNLARLFDDLQQQTRQGPCMDAMYEHETVRVDDLATDQRWPDLGRRAAELGLRSMLCFQLFVHGDDLGALNVLSRHPRAFTDESERIGLLYASHTAVALAQAQKINSLELGMASRDVIGQAKGVLMERYKITEDQAFAVLAKASQDTNRKLIEVAANLTQTGVLTSEGRH